MMAKLVFGVGLQESLAFSVADQRSGSLGNKVLRCAPEQLRRLTVDQEAAIKFVTADMIQAQRQLSDRGAQVFTDIGQEEFPLVDEDSPEPSAKRARGCGGISFTIRSSTGWERRRN